MRIAMYAGKGTNSRKLTRLLRMWGFEVIPMRDPALPELRYSDFQVLYLPGGWYRFDQATNRKILEFVRKGGGCVGTCAGAYLVAGYIPIIPGRVLRANMRGRLYLEPQNGRHPILRGVVQKCTRHRERKWEPIAVTHMGGPFILPDERSTIVASYDWEGEIGAIVAAQIGKGRAVAIASHPEEPLAALPVGDSFRRAKKALLQGDQRRIVLNAVLWAARRRIPKSQES